MKRNQLFIVFIAVIAILAFTACSGNSEGEDMDKNSNLEETNNETANEEAETSDNEDSSAADEVPAEPEPAENPKYEVGSKAMIETDHMEGMKGAEATISGAYSTNVYTVTYTPTTGGEEVSNHKWVIQEEIKEAGSELLEPKTEVILEADHMKGMKGAEATIDSGEETTVYMIDYTPTNSEERVTDHKWVTEDELSPADESQ